MVATLNQQDGLTKYSIARTYPQGTRTKSGWVRGRDWLVAWAGGELSERDDTHPPSTTNERAWD